MPQALLGLVLIMLTLLASSSAAQTPSGALGPVHALGQEVARPQAPSGPAPRLGDGTIDLGDGIWISIP